MDATREKLLDALADGIVAVALPHPVRVAIDGVDGAGKTTLADELAPLLRSRGRPVIRASVDDFHHPAAHRYRAGRHSPEGYFRDSFDYTALRRRLLDPLGPEGDLGYRVACFDYRRDAPVEPPTERAEPDSILLLDGIFLQRPELRGGFDWTLFLEVPFEVTVARMAERDGGPTDVEAPGNRRYVGGQRIYLQECEPRRSADVVVDNRDLRRPGIVREGRNP